jgi:transcriptional regulator with XRE-family HTH domain
MRPNLTSAQIGKIICALRKHKEISQEQLAQALHIPRSSMSQIENGGRELSFIEFQEILTLFEVSFEEFIAHVQPLKEIASAKKKGINQKIKFDAARF